MADTNELREMIADIDQQIIELIATRMEIADELAKAKKKSYITGAHGSGSAKKKAKIRERRANRGKK